MEELVNLVMKKTGLPKETAQMAVRTVLDFLKKKLPPAVGTTIDGFLNNQGQIEAAEQLLGGILNAAQKTTKKK